MMKVAVKPELLRWARERARLDEAALVARFPKLADWESGTARPTLKQLEDFAKATYALVGYLFLETPPDEQVPIPDFRTIGGAGIARPSPDLLEMVYACQQRQEWYRDYARSMSEDARPFVGSARITDDVLTTPHASAMRSASTWRNAASSRPGLRRCAGLSSRRTGSESSSCAAAWC